MTQRYEKLRILKQEQYSAKRIFKNFNNKKYTWICANFTTQTYEFSNYDNKGASRRTYYLIMISG